MEIENKFKNLESKEYLSIEEINYILNNLNTSLNQNEKNDLINKIDITSNSLNLKEFLILLIKYQRDIDITEELCGIFRHFDSNLNGKIYKSKLRDELLDVINNENINEYELDEILDFAADDKDNINYIKLLRNMFDNS